MAKFERFCWYCGKRTNLKGTPHENYFDCHERDHVVPKSVSKYITFKVDACVGCNRKKDNLTIQEFRLAFFGDLHHRFAGEQIGIGHPSFDSDPFHALLRPGTELPGPVYEAWFAAAAELSRRFDPNHQERYYAYDAP
jgi:hypothetical protein